MPHGPTQRKKMVLQHLSGVFSLRISIDQTIQLSENLGKQTAAAAFTKYEHFPGAVGQNSTTRKSLRIRWIA